MPESYYPKEVEAVQRAINCLRSEDDQSLTTELQAEQQAAGTSLEWYGITKNVFERFLASRPLSDKTRAAMRAAVHAVGVIYGSEKA